MNIGLIGCGYWGINYIRVFSELRDSVVATVCDVDQERLDMVKKRFPWVKEAGIFQQFLCDPKVEAVVVATPTCTHYEIAKESLLHDKHVLVEKPLATKVEEGEELVELAKKRKRVLMVGHTFLYNPGIRKMKECIESDDFGQVYYLNATRTHLGLIRSDVNAIWDLAPHDVSIFNYLMNAQPLWVSAVGASCLHNNREDVGFITLSYPQGIVGNIRVSWIDSNKVREVVVVGSKKRVVFDDLNNLEKIRIFEKGASITGGVDSFGEFQLSLRDGDIISPKVETSEPLKNQCAHFLDCIQHGSTPLTDGWNGLTVVKVMVAIEQSLRANGMRINVGKR